MVKEGAKCNFLHRRRKPVNWKVKATVNWMVKATVNWMVKATVNWMVKVSCKRKGSESSREVVHKLIKFSEA